AAQELSDFASATTDELVEFDVKPAEHVSATEEMTVEPPAADTEEPASDQFHATTYYYLTPEPVADRAADTVEDLAPYVEEAVGLDDYTDEGVAVEHFDPAPSYGVAPNFEYDSAMHADGFSEPDAAPTEATTQRLDQHLQPHSDGFACPFCSSVNDPLPFVCTTCHSVLTLSDIESLLSNPGVDREVVQRAVTQMEAEWNLRDFTERELIDLGIGAFNLGNSASGFRYLQEASRLNPNNVILAGQVNALAIRMEEIERQAEANNLLPKGKTIMVVDDSATVRKLISGKLEKSGHNVVCAVDGVDALERLAEVLPDLVLLDITMPRMDGYEVCKQIRANPVAKNVPVVMISGKDGFFDKVRGRMAGTSGYVTKPFGPETLMKALETYLLPVVDGEEVQADVEVEVMA
ncbi:MAG: response regulator, partial [Acidobacteriota bacterium]